MRGVQGNCPALISIAYFPPCFIDIVMIPLLLHTTNQITRGGIS